MTDGIPVVSVCLLAYNHERYIRQCLDSVLSQQTNFEFEVIVHDDASTDGTADIIREYQSKYPDIVKPILQSENQHDRIGILGIYREWIYPKAQGDYFAYCECDDYWTDEQKLQLQFDALSRDRNSTMCTHSTRFVNEEGTSTGDYCPKGCFVSGPIKPREMLSRLTNGGGYFHTTSFFCRAILARQLLEENPLFLQHSYAIDIPTLLYFGSKGPITYLDRFMSDYRRGSTGSWQESVARNRTKRVYWKKEQIKVYESFDKYTDGIYSDCCKQWIEGERFSIAEIENDFVEMSKPCYEKYFIGRPHSFRWKVRVAGLLQEAGLFRGATNYSELTPKR